MNKDSKIYVAGHLGLVGSAIFKNLKAKGYTNFVLRPFDQLDLTNQQSVDIFFKNERPEYVFLAAAKVGGIMANNTYRAQFIYENIMIQNNVIHSSWKYGVKKLLFLGSTCIYPKEASQPMIESALLTAPLEYTNEPYAIAKIAGIKMCESYNLQYGTNFISVMPTNLYGPNDNFNLETSHVLPAILRKIHLGSCLENNDWDSVIADLDKRPIDEINGSFSKEDILSVLSKYGIIKVNDTVSVEIWGTGAPLREFLWSDEMAEACIFVMEKVNFSDLIQGHEVRNTHINIGSGEEITIKNLANLIQKCIGFNGHVTFNTAKPDGTLRKLTNPSKIHALGWHHQVEIEEGVARLYNWYLSNL
jgi:GDP-L-fucose synthase